MDLHGRVWSSSLGCTISRQTPVAFLHMLQRDVMLLEQQRMSRCMRCAQPRAAPAATESDVTGRHVELYDGRPVGGHRPRTGWCGLSAASAAVCIRMQRDTRYSMVTCATEQSQLTPLSLYMCGHDPDVLHCKLQ